MVGYLLQAEHIQDEALSNYLTASASYILGTLHFRGEQPATHLKPSRTSPVRSSLTFLPPLPFLPSALFSST